MPVKTLIKDEFVVKGLDFKANTSPNKATLTAEECKSFCKKSGIEYLEGYENQVFQFTLTDATVDRMNEVVLPKGVDFTLYKTNPVVLAFHESRNYPVGSCIKIWYDKESEAVKGWILFMDSRVDPSGASSICMKMVQAGFLKTGSIGFRIKEAHNPTAEEIKAFGFNEKNYSLIIDKCELMEFSIVPIPANPSARAEVLTKMFSINSLNTEEKNFLEKQGNDINKEPETTIENAAATTLIDPTNVTTPENNGDGEKGDDNKNVADSEIKKYPLEGMLKLTAHLDPTKVSNEDLLKQVAEFKALALEGAEVNITIGEKAQPELIEGIVSNVKAGASISAKNKTVIKEAHDLCEKACNTLKSFVMEDPEEEKPSSVLPEKTITLVEEHKKTMSDLFSNLFKQ